MDAAPPPRALDEARRFEMALVIQNLLNLLQVEHGHRGEYDTLVAVSRQHPADLFAYDPKWYTPLLKTARGLEVFGELLSTRSYYLLLVVDDHDDDVDLAQLMRACFLIQSTSAVKLIRVLSTCFPRSFFKAVRYYTHPDQADALAQLKASLPTPPSFKAVRSNIFGQFKAAPVPQQHNVPPEALPLLFPQIDTTQFAPQFDWFIYLLSQFSPVDETEYTTRLTALLDFIFHPTAFLSLKPGFTLDQIFTHNHLINSYDEFLHHKLPQVLPLIQAADQREEEEEEDTHSQTIAPSSTTSAATATPTSSSTTPNLLFPYFPQQHLLLPSIKSQDEFSALLSNPTQTFTDYFIYMFILGPWIQTTTAIPHFDTKLASTPFSLSTKLAFHQYRAWHRDTISTAPTAPTTDNPSSNNTSTNNQTTTDNIQPPDFATIPLTLLALTVTPKRALSFHDICRPAQLPQSISWSTDDSPILLQAYLRFLFHILAHYYPNKSTHDDILEHLLFEIPSSLPYGAIFNFSYSLYQHGYKTLHQHMYDFCLTVKYNVMSFDQIVSHFLHDPLVATDWEGFNWNDLTQHIALCVHAGVLTPFPLPSPPVPYSSRYPLEVSDPVNSDDGDDDGDDDDDDDDGDDEKQGHFLEFASQLATLRATLHAVLVRLTGFISYFPQSTQLVATTLHTAAPQMDFGDPLPGSYRPEPSYLPFLPLHSLAIPDPRDDVPDLKAALVDDEGKLFAVKYASDNNSAGDELADDELTNGGSSDDASDDDDDDNDDDEDNDEDNEEMPDEMAQLLGKYWAVHPVPFQGAARHKHLLHGTVDDDLQACVNWCRPREDDPEPGSLPRVSDEDMAWIDSEDNEDNLNLPKTRQLQKKLTAYYRKVNKAETEMVIAQMHKVLNNAYAAGLCDASNAGQKRKQPPRSTDDVSTEPDASHAPVPQSTLLRPQPRAYPLPSLPKTSNLIKHPKHDRDDGTFSKQRGVFHWDESWQTFFFYDDNHAPHLFRWKYLSDMPPDIAKGLYDAERKPKIDGAVPAADFFRQRSEWALELLMVGCFGLDAVSTQTPRPPMIHTPQQALQTSSLEPSTNPHLQQCKDHLLQHLAILVNTIQQTPTVVSSTYSLQPAATVPLRQVRLGYFYDTLTHLTLLTALPLYDTLASLPCSSPQPPPPQSHQAPCASDKTE